MKTTDLIESLSKEAEAVTPAKPTTVFAKWLLFSVIYLALMLLIFGLRDDVGQKLQGTLFVFEVAALLLLSLAVGISAIILSYPDAYQRKYLVYLPLVPLLLFIASLIMQAQSQSQLPLHEQEEMLGCFLCICLLAFGPALLLFRQLIKNASTTPRFASAMAVLAAFSLGALTVRLSEKVDSMGHIIAFHYFPLLVLSAIGFAIGRKLLKW